MAPVINSTGAVTFTSLNTDKATVNSTTGVVSGVSAGDATIRVSVAADDYWQAGSKEITVTVTATSKKYTKVASMTPGKTYLIVNAANNCIMPHPGSSKSTLAKVDVTITSNQITQTASTQACEFVFTTETIESESVNLISYTEDETTYYLNGGSDTKLGRLSTKPSVLDNNAIWTVSTTSDYGSFRIQNRKNNTRYIVLRTSTYNVFGGYTNAPNGTEYYNVDLFQLED